MDNEVSMFPPSDMTLAKSDHACKLIKSPYNLRQASTMVFKVVFCH